MTHLASIGASDYDPAMTPVPPRKATRLAQALTTAPTERAGPLDLFELAQRRWRQGERVDVGALAAELGIGRATAFRWVGSRDALLGEILWAQCDAQMRRAASAQRGQAHGPARVGAICAGAMRAIVRSVPLRRFLREDPEQALRLLTSKQGPVQARAVARVRELLDAEAARGALHLPIEANTLAFLVVRVCESFLYAGAISDQRVDLADAALAVELLLSGRVSTPAAARRKSAKK
jgi:AcrR family transcriptional regulator